MHKFSALALVLAGLSPAAQAQFLGNAYFSAALTSQGGTVTNNLVITNFAAHFTVSGQVLIAVAPGPQAGGWCIGRSCACWTRAGSAMRCTPAPS